MKNDLKRVRERVLFTKRKREKEKKRLN